jgi:hypothetical protein
MFPQRPDMPVRMAIGVRADGDGVVPAASALLKQSETISARITRDRNKFFVVFMVLPFCVPC